MKILYISSIQLFPIQNGGAQVTCQYLRELSKNNEAALITVRAQDNTSKKGFINRHIRIYDYLSDNPIIKFLSPFTYIEILIQINKYRPDKLIIDFPWFGIVGIASKFIFKTPFYIRSHNVEYLRMKRLHKWFWFILKIYEKIVYTYAERIICISELDKKTLESELNVSAQKIDVSEYYPDPNIFKKNIRTRKMIRKLLNIENKFVVLFFGSLDYQPNMEAVNIIKDKIASMALKQNNNIIFLIVGRNPKTLKSERNIIFTDYVEKIEDYINASDLVIVPLISGGGIRTKIIESIACGKTVLSTPIGAEGISKEAYGKQLIVTSGWDTFSRSITRVFCSKSKVTFF